MVKANFEFYLDVEVYEKLCKLTKDMGEEYEANALEKIIENACIEMREMIEMGEAHERGEI